MSPFEFASSLISIIIGLGMARALGGVGAFATSEDRSAAAWIIAGWCVVMLLNLAGWWIATWNGLQGRLEIGLAELWAMLIVTALLYLATYVLLPGSLLGGSTETTHATERPGNAFYYCLASHFVVAMLVLAGFGIGRAPTFRENALPMAAIAIVAFVGRFATSDRLRAIHLAVYAIALALVLSDRVGSIAAR